MFLFIPCAVHAVFHKIEDEKNVRIVKSRVCGRKKREVTDLQKENLTLSVAHYYCNPLHISMSIVMGFFFGLFLHLVPCWWWTCDWGYYDGY